MRVEEVIDTQQKLLTELNNVGIMTPELAREFRNENLKLKEQVLSETVRLQELINDAEDLNDYRDIIKKQNKMIDDTTKGFVEIDNNLSVKHEELEKGAKIFKDTFEKKMKEFEVGYEYAEGLEEELQEKEEEISTLKLILERNELREQNLKQELTAMENRIDKEGDKFLDKFFEENF